MKKNPGGVHIGMPLPSIQNLGAADISRLMSHLKMTTPDVELPPNVLRDIKMWRQFAVSALKIDIARSSAIIRLAKTPRKKSGAKSVQEKQRQLLKIAQRQSGRQLVDPELFFIIRERMNEYFSLLKNDSINASVNVNKRKVLNYTRLDSPLIAQLIELETAHKMYVAEKKRPSAYTYTKTSPRPETLLAHAEKEMITIRMNLDDIVHIVNRLSKRRENAWIVKEMREIVRIQKMYLSDYQRAADKWRRIVKSKKIPKKFPSLFPLKSSGTGIRMQTAILHAIKKLVAPPTEHNAPRVTKRALDATSPFLTTPMGVNSKRSHSGPSIFLKRPLVTPMNINVKGLGKRPRV